jgi:hypothetical protein
MGRVSTATDLLIGVPQTTSMAAGAILVSTVDHRWMFATAAIGLTVVAAMLWQQRNPTAAPRIPAPQHASGASLPQARPAHALDEQQEVAHVPSTKERGEPRGSVPPPSRRHDLVKRASRNHSSGTRGHRMVAYR